MAAPYARNYLFLFLLALLTWIVLFLANRVFPELLHPGHTLPLVSGFTVISLSAFLIFFAGIKKDTEGSVFHTLIALGVKMLSSFVFALLFFIVFKNRGTGSVILFFVLYLEFTLFVVFTFLSVLKSKSV
jgi:hypothetical protein